MNHTDYLLRIRALLAEYQDAWAISHADYSTGKVDDADVQKHMDELVTLIAYLDNTIAHAESKARHV